jgi:O-antigen/teichoic acid export membrane protein
LFAGKMVGGFGFFIVAVLLARSFSVANRGVIAYVNSLTVIFGIVAAFGVNDTLTVLGARNAGSRARLFAGGLLLAVGLGLLVGVGVSTILLAVPAIRPRGVGIWVGVLMTIAIATAAGQSAAVGALSGAGRLRVLSVLRLLPAWIYLVTLVGVALTTHLTVTRAIACLAAGNAGALIIMVWVAASRVGFRAPTRALILDQLHFGVRVWIGNILHQLNSRVDQPLVAILASYAALGVYAVGVNASEILLEVPLAISSVVVAITPRLDQQERVARFQRALRVTLAMAVIELAAAIATGPFLIPIAFGGRFHASVVPFLILSVGVIGFTPLVLVQTFLVGAGRPGTASAGVLAAVIVEVALDFALVPAFGATGAAIAAATAFLASGAAALAAFRLTVERVPWRSFAPRPADLMVVVTGLRRAAASR